MGIFKKGIDPRCLYCSYGRPLGHGMAGCVYRGVVKEYFHCNRFRYDPLRRVPAKPTKLGRNYTDKDFEL